MPVGTPFHPRTAALCESMSWRDWAGYFNAGGEAKDGHTPAEVETAIYAEIAKLQQAEVPAQFDNAAGQRRLPRHGHRERQSRHGDRLDAGAGAFHNSV